MNKEEIERLKKLKEFVDDIEKRFRDINEAFIEAGPRFLTKEQLEHQNNREENDKRRYENTFGGTWHDRR